MPDDLPAVLADPALLERVIANVVSNALRYSPPDRPPLVTASTFAEHLELRIVDRGPGIPEGDRERVFAPFQRLGDRDNSTGVGLGLALSRGLVESMGGSLTPEDTPGGGLTMVVRLPIAPDRSPATATLDARTTAPMSRLLVVDDEPQLLRALRITLSARGHQVRTAPDGRHALADAAAHPPDVVILDLGLPDMDGIEVIQGLRGWTKAPIIVLSGRAGSSDKVGALDAGADDYVTKPFGVDELLARLRAVSRRAGHDDVPEIQVGAYTIDLAARRVHLGVGSAVADGESGDPDAESDVRLTPTEWHILEILVRHPGKLISQRQLLTEVWGPAYTNEFHYLRQYLARLRHKLEPDPARPRHLLTEPGMGYRFQP